MAVAGKELLNVLGDVKARVQDKLGITDFPMPQFILIGKQSVGKSRLIESLAGEPFSFVSGTLGSRRPTILEFRNVPSQAQSRWFVRDRKTLSWGEYPTSKVMEMVGQSHEELGETVSEDPICVRVESESCVDMQIVDLPGFRDFAVDAAKQELSAKIADLVGGFMKQKQNVMLCVEQASDAANMSTLARCREMDPKFERTVLIRNKLDKYYKDLTSDNVNKWVQGFGDIPENLTCFALTLPHWQDGSAPSQPFPVLRENSNAEDVRVMQGLGLQGKHLQGIGFNHFTSFMEKKIERMFNDALSPVMQNLQTMKGELQRKETGLNQEFQETDPVRISTTTCDCGKGFAQCLNFVMEGQLNLTEGCVTLDDELRAFHEHHKALGTDFAMLPSDEFRGLEDYIDYLRNEIRIGAFDIRVNGGAQFRRMMMEVEIFLRFSEIAVDVKKKDVIQARGVSMSSLTWRDVVVKLLGNEAHLPLVRQVRYVGERVKWFFETQKDAVLQFMSSLEGRPMEKMYNAHYVKQVKFIKQNEMIKHLVYQTYDNVCKRQLHFFMDLFESMLTSTFSNPWVFLKGATAGASDDEGPAPEVLMDTLKRIPEEIRSRTGIEATLQQWLQDIPTESHEIDDAVDRVQMLVLKTYSFIRSQVCDQVELFAESFFKLPMMRRLEEEMDNMELSEVDKTNYQARRDRLQSEISAAKDALKEVSECVDQLQGFQIKCEARSLV